MLSEQTDAALLTTSEGFELFVRRHQAALFRYLRTISRSEEDAEDALQRAFLSSWRAASTFQGSGEAKAWLFTIGRHEALRVRRPKAGEPKVLDELNEQELGELGLAAGWGDPEACASSNEQHDALLQALSSLPHEDKEILTLRDIEGLPGHEVQAVLGLTLTAMKSRLHRARLRLMGALQREVSHER